MEDRAPRPSPRSRGSRVLLILAHLLVPAEFGIASIVMAFAIFVPLFADLGLGAALIQAPDADGGRPVDGVLDIAPAWAWAS